MIKIGDTIDSRYNVLSHLGTGGMAVVFECKDIFTGKLVAVKILKEELLDDKTSLLDFEREVKASITMSHPNIMEIYEEGKWNNRPYLVLEYLESQTLLDQIEMYTKFSVKEAAEIMLQLLDAIQYTHEHKIIHRDIKPQNVFYLSNGTIKLGDFGIAKNEKDTEIDEKIMGSVHYLAPEVLLGKPFSIASDIYAAGITFFQLITGVLPYDGTTKEIADMQINREFPKPSFFNKTISIEIEEVIMKAVSKNPKTRFRSASEFKDALQNALEGKRMKKSLFGRLF